MFPNHIEKIYKFKVFIIKNKWTKGVIQDLRKKDIYHYIMRKNKSDNTKEKTTIFICKSRSYSKN